MNELERVKQLIYDFYEHHPDMNSQNNLDISLLESILALSAKERVIAFIYINLKSRIMGKEISPSTLASHFKVSRSYISTNIKINYENFLEEYGELIKQNLKDKVSNACFNMPIFIGFKPILNKMIEKLSDEMLLRRQDTVTAILLNFISKKQGIKGIINTLSDNFQVSSSNIYMQTQSLYEYLENLYQKSI